VRSAEERTDAAAATIEVMRVEMEALSMQLQQEKLDAQDAQRSMREELALTRDARADAQAKCYAAMHERDHISSEGLKLRVRPPLTRVCHQSVPALRRS
jgi:hypothetical protein